MWLVEVVNAKIQLLVLKKFCFKYMISLIKPNCHFSELESQKVMHDSHGNKGTILFLSSVNFPMSVISTKLYFVEIG